MERPIRFCLAKAGLNLIGLVEQTNQDNPL